MAEDWGVQSNLKVIDRLIRLENRFVVDAGCGNGALSRKLAERGARVLGIEPDPVQAGKNEVAEPVPNVGFAQAGAGDIPVESGSVDGIIFGNSLHHVPSAHFEMVFREVERILKKDGFLYVQEPVANGQYQDAMELFHDETEVRLAAYRALCKYAHPAYRRMREIYYDIDRRYASFDEFADHYARLSYNTSSYSESDVRNEEVQRRFERYRADSGGYSLRQPMRVNVYSNAA